MFYQKQLQTLLLDVYKNCMGPFLVWGKSFLKSVMIELILVLE